MKRTFTLLLSIMALAGSLHGQLARRAQLGTALLDVTDSIAHLHQMPSPQGVFVHSVVPHSSADVMGIEPHDLLLELNGTAYHQRAGFSRAVATLRGGDTARIKISRKGTVKTLKGTLLAAPEESIPYAEVIYDAVPFDGGYARTIIYKPESQKPMPAFFFIQGYVCHSMERVPDSPYDHLFTELARRGYVVIRTEKASVGDSQNNRHCSDYNFQEETALFSASYNALKKYNFIDHDNVFIFGHSMGGVQAPLLETDFDPKGIAVFGTIVRPWFEYFVEIARKQRLLRGNDYLENEANHQTAVRFYYQLMIDKKTPTQLAADPQMKEYMQNHFSWDGQQKFYGKHYTFWQQLQDNKMFKAWAQTPAHVLSIWGEGEVVAFNSYEHTLIADIVNHYNPGKAQYLQMPNIDHGFLWVRDRQHANQVSGDHFHYYNNFNQNLVLVLDDWMRSLK